MKYKMSDVFDLPVECETNVQGNHYLIDANGAALGDMVTIDFDNMVSHAINNHDRLSHENIDLRNALKVSNGTNKKLKDKNTKLTEQVEKLKAALELISRELHMTIEADLWNMETLHINQLLLNSIEEENK